ncbi:hypothetical protein [Saliphagus sp. LR7]|uniref:hypothetical protein n=1 Tax=Saliphagus sp. LR7 TaxID=2282654 RepID=UPI000DF74CE9|nr:hypothetical protein [Saliphagus sp. LR7]
MLPDSVRDEIIEALPDLYWVDVSHPDDAISEVALEPQLRKHRAGFEEPPEPYESVALAWPETGVIEETNPVDNHVATERFDPDEVEEGHAHGREIKGHNSYDTLELIVTAEGTAMIADEVVGPRDRAVALCDAVHSFLTETWPSRPLDLFDEQGAPIDDSHPTVPDTFADELSVSVLPREIPGRGTTDMSDQVEDSEAQCNAAVELAYVDSWSEFHYVTEEIDPEVEAGPDPYDTR